MKSYVYAAIAALVLAAPIASYAAQQDNAPVTRAQVKAELVELEKAGYNPGNWYNYPENLQAAEQKVAAMHAKQQNQGG